GDARLPARWIVADEVIRTPGQRRLGRWTFGRSAVDHAQADRRGAGGAATEPQQRPSVGRPDCVTLPTRHEGRSGGGLPDVRLEGERQALQLAGSALPDGFGVVLARPPDLIR